jgi:hypothetical protein
MGLPSDVESDIQTNRRIEASKLLLEQQNLDLKIARTFFCVLPTHPPQGRPLLTTVLMMLFCPEQFVSFPGDAPGGHAYG